MSFRWLEMVLQALTGMMQRNSRDISQKQSKSWQGDANKMYYAHFTSKELECPCCHVNGMDENFMAKDAVAVVSSLDEPAVELLEKRGYNVLDEPQKGRYPKSTPILYATNTFKNGLAGFNVKKPPEDLTYMPCGMFTVLQKT